jgi:hypothetical protein
LFQAMEDALRSGAPAFVLGEVWRLKAYDLTVSRRLLLAAHAGATPALRNRRDAQCARAFGGGGARPAGAAELRRPPRQSAHRVGAGTPCRTRSNEAHPSCVA